MADLALQLEAHPPDGAPQCWGKAWKQSESACNGGPDPTFFNVRTKTAERDPCKWVAGCANVVRGEQQLISEANLLKQQQPSVQNQAFSSILQAFSPNVGGVQRLQPPAQSTPIATVAPPPTNNELLLQQLALERQRNAEMSAALQRGATMPAGSQMFPVNYRLPAYLTAEEKKGSYAQRATVEAVRAAGKGFFHQMAAFLDSNSLLDVILEDTDK